MGDEALGFYGPDLESEEAFETKVEELVKELGHCGGQQ